MVDVDKAIVARAKIGGKNFEVLVDCDNALKMKEEKKIDMSDVLASEDVFIDNKKGTRATEADLKKCFGTTDILDVASRLL